MTPTKIRQRLREDDRIDEREYVAVLEYVHDDGR